MRVRNTLNALIGLVAVTVICSPIGLTPRRDLHSGTAPIHRNTAVIHGATPDHVSFIENALTTYQDAGLDLPHLRIFVHEERSGCGGWAGIYDSDGSANRIDLCGEVLLHELAHAWLHHNLDQTRRTAYMERMKLTVWHDPSTRHSARGVEHAANLVGWGVQNDPLNPARIDLYAQRLADYKLLTGMESLRIGRCERSERDSNGQNLPTGRRRLVGPPRRRGPRRAVVSRPKSHP